STDAVTGKTTTTSTNDVLGHQANPVINGYTVTTNPTEATTDQTAKLGDTDTEYNVVYTKNSPTITTDTVNKTVHYVDVDGNKMADDFTSSANFTTSTDAVTGKATTTSTNDVLGHQANPVINGYTVTTNPAAATTDQTVKSGDTDTEYTVVYTKNSPTTTTDTVNKIVHYVDADGNQLANDFTSSADFTSSTDAVTGKTTTTSTNDVLGHQANPVINGYTITTNPTEATTDQTVKSGDTDTEYTVVYTKNAPIITTDTVNKTVHYVDADGNKLADDFTSSADFTTSTDAVTGKTTTSSTNDVLGHQVNPEIPGYTVTTNPAEATTDQTVKSGDTDAEYTVIYTKNTPTTTTDTVNKTIHYVDADGNQLANDFTSQADFTTSTDAVTGKTTTTSTNDILGHQANPVINGYTVTTNPAQATTDQTAKLGDTDAEYTVVYTKNAPTTTTDTTTPKTTDEVSVTPKQPTVTQPVAVIPTAPTKNTVTPVTTTANPVVTTTTNTLPQTGEKSSPLMLVAGLSMLMMIMSFLGIEIKKQH
ncbi:LPXTG cell wall anchor domain-containing protein, partial [Paucilactobacillus oligofermentans]|uniref:LPXTG cell wall anchor domain-containing protein n=1 Tax=Paucilactobacillus oligofermentans TaxID=293371 RepID=UPI00138ED5B6